MRLDDLRQEGLPPWTTLSHLCDERMMVPGLPSSHFPNALVLIFVLPNKDFIEIGTSPLLNPGCSHTRHRGPGTSGSRFETSSTLSWLHGLE